MNRRRFLTLSTAGLLAGIPRQVRSQSRPPNIVLIVADDLGYGDVGYMGSKIRTPNIDRMATEGVRFTQFYAASALCSPSRAALLTGRYPVRMNMVGVLFPDENRGIPDNETTIGQVMQRAGYRTSCVGKWHVGSSTQFAPNNRGFDEFFGLLTSHDMYPLQLYRQTDAIENNPRNDMFTQRFTQEAVDFISRQKDSPFFLYLPYTAPHIPLRASAPFRRKSPLGTYGDVVEELDWGVGAVLQAIQDNGLDENTLVIFTSDNGPWYQGSTGSLRGRKGESYEGGMRVPFVARFPGRIQPDTSVPAMSTTMDLLPTILRLAGGRWPSLPLDGVDIWPLLNGDATDVGRDVFLYFDYWEMQCARMGPWKLHLSRYNTPPWMPPPPEGRWNLPLPKPELYNMDTDSEEGYEDSENYPELVAEIRQRVDNQLLTFPSRVRDAFRYTMNLQVEATPVGAPPIRKVP